MEQLSSNVGLGWNLNAGGVITREVKGFPDDVIKNNYGVTQYGWLHGPPGNLNSAGCKTEEFSVIDEELENELTLALSELMGDPVLGYDNEFDTEPDLFHFKFGGRTGSFVFLNCMTDPESAIIQLIPYQDLEISYVLDYGDEIKSFTIIDENGNQYEFDQIEYTHTNTKTEIAAGEELSANFYKDLYTEQSYRSAWFLSSITNPLGEDIQFYYEQERVTLDKSYYYEYRNSCSEVCTKLILNDNNYSFKPKIITKRISSIETENMEIEFIALTLRRDVNQDYINELLRCRAIDDIIIKNKIGIPGTIRGFHLEYDYFLRRGDDTIRTSRYNQHESGFERLMLKSVQEFNGDLILPPYIFGYNYDPDDDEKKLPSRFSYSRDMWGYFNGKLNVSFIPTIYVYPEETGSDRFSVYEWQGDVEEPIELSSSDIRTVNVEKAKLLTLNLIKYPNGGHSTFSYGYKMFRHNDENYYGGGLLISEVEHYDDVDLQNNISTSYYYHTVDEDIELSGRVIQLPVIGYFDPRKWPNTETAGYYDSAYVRTNANLSNVAECVVVFEEVWEYTNGTGKTCFKFNVPGIYGEYEDGELFKTFESKYVRHTNDILGTNSYNLGGLHFDYYAYPYPNSTNYDWNRGLLMQKTMFDESENVVSEVQNEYGTFYAPGSSMPGKVIGVKVGFLENNINELVEPVTVYSIYDIITNVSKKLTSSTQKIFDQENPTKFASTTTDYKYNDYGQLAEVISINSDLTEKTTRYTYPTDLDLAEGTDDYSEAVYKMKNEFHIHSPILETQILENKPGESNRYVVGGTITKFKDHNDAPDVSRILPLEVLALETDTRIEETSFTGLQCSPGGNVLSFDERYKTKLIFDDYNSKGRLIESHNINNIHNINIYGYNSTINHASIINASSGECAFQSYEAPSTETPLWYKPTSQYQSISIEKVHSGDYSLEIEASSYQGQEPEGMAIKTFVLNNLDVSKKYTFSAWIYSDDQNADLSVILLARDINNNEIESASSSYSIQSLGEWQYVNVELDLSQLSNFNSLDAIILNDGNGIIAFFDDLKFYPSDALMTSQTYKPFVGKTSVSDANEYYEHYEYDDLGRMIRVKDKDGNITGTTNYNTKQLPLKLQPLYQEFGTCLVNVESDIYEFQITNNTEGIQTVDVSIIEDIDNNYEIVENGGEQTIDPDEILSVRIKFLPTSTGFKNSKLKISCSAIPEDIKAILSGYAVNKLFDVSLPENIPSGEVVSFEDTYTISPKEKTFVLHNYTLNPLEVNISIDDGTEYYSIVDSPGSFTMDETSEHSFKIKFSPLIDDVEFRQGNLNIYADLNNIDVPLEGNGITPVLFQIDIPPELETNPVTPTPPDSGYIFDIDISYPSPTISVQPTDIKWYKMHEGIWTFEGYGSPIEVPVNGQDCYNGKFHLKCTITYLEYEYERIFEANFFGCNN